MTKSGKTICVFSPKGGVGKTILSLNLAGVASSMDYRVLIMDFAVHTGAVSMVIDDEIKKRGKLVRRYNQRLQNIQGLQLPKIQKGIKTNFAYFPIVINENEFGSSRDDIYEKLKDNNILARKYFFPLTNKFECYDGMYDKYPTPIALKISQRVLTLPLYADLEDNVINEICDIILS